VCKCSLRAGNSTGNTGYIRFDESNDDYDASRRSFLTTLKASEHGYSVQGHMEIISSGRGAWTDQGGAQATSVAARLAAPIPLPL
jgi:hypothetical protein